MISRFHILSFFVIAGLYMVVAIWKLNRPENRSSREGIMQMEEKIAEEAVFWKHYNKGNELRRESQYEQAAIEYARAIKKKWKHKDALYYAGSMYLMTRDYHQAMSFWSRLKEQEPNAPRTLLQLGTLQSCMDADNPHFDLTKAEEWISEAWKLNREETGAPLLLVKLHMLQNRYADAVDLLDDLLSVNETEEQALFLSGYIQWKWENRGKAQRLLRDARLHNQQGTTKGLRGEGATKKGKAMLAEGRFCDSIETAIIRLLDSSNFDSVDNTYSNFQKELNYLRSILRIS